MVATARSLTPEPLAPLPRLALAPIPPLALILKRPDEFGPVCYYLLRLNTHASRVTMLNHLRRAAHFWGLPLRDVRWAEVRHTHVVEMRARMIHHGCAPATTNGALTAVKEVMREARRQRLIERDVLDDILDVPRVPGGPRRPARALRAPSVGGLLRAVVNAENEVTALRDAALLALLVGAGLRRSEAVGLQLSHYQPAERVLVVCGKGGRVRRVYLEDAGTHRALTSWLAVRGDWPGPLLCPVNRGGRVTTTRTLTTDAVYKAVKKYAEAAGVEGCSPHALRHTFGTLIAGRGAPMSDVQELLGHARLDTTSGYIHADEESQRRSSRRIGLRFPGRRRRRGRSRRRRRPAARPIYLSAVSVRPVELARTRGRPPVRVGDWIVTLPRHVEWGDFERDLDAVRDGSRLLNHRIPRAPEGMRAGDRCYLVWRGRVRGWMRIVAVADQAEGFRCEATGREFPAGVYVQSAGEFHRVDGPAMQGFHGVRRYEPAAGGEGAAAGQGSGRV